MIGTFFYNIIIAPIYDLLEFFYVFFSSITSKGLAVISLSFVVTLFCLPLYIVAERWQEEERNIQAKLKSGARRIKETFTGDEQYMILTAYYKENHYHPIMALRSSFSLLIQIPFFIAAYSFLSNLESLQGYSFLFVRDFGSPDRTFMLGSFPINILPIAMTLINIIAGAIYSKGHGFKEQTQIYAMALVFLAILYNSPAGLVVYWTMNNILSLVKNIFYKLKNPRKVFWILCVLVLFASIAWAFTTGKKIYIIGTILLFVLVLFSSQIAKVYDSFIRKRILFFDSDKTPRNKTFWFSAIATAFFAGAVLPSFIIESSPANFCFIDGYKSPFVFIAIPFLQALGLFVFWPACLYCLFSEKFKKSAAIFYPIFFIVSILNCFVFEGNYGPMNVDLTFMHESAFPKMNENLLNWISIAAIAAVLIFVLEKFPKLINYTILIFSISFAAVFLKNTNSLKTTFENMSHEEISKIEPIYHLSKTEKNILVIMQDRCLSPVIPEVFEELPALAEKYDGFTYYPNTVSMSYYTQLGAIGLFGGYDYTPYELNKWDETIQKKHNESILSMPKVFSDSGWNVSLADMPYENYGEEPVEQIYTGLNNFERHIAKGMYTKLWYEANGKEPYPIQSILLKRNFLYLSLFKIAVPILRPIIYHRGWWIQSNSKMDEREFMDSYAPLDFMPKLTDFSSERPTFSMLVNEVTHDPEFLQAPEYRPVETVTNYGTSKYSMSKSYHAAASALLRWSEFFDYLKANGVYDNTRIVIVSDHGDATNSGKFEETFKEFRKEEVTATLLVKDFSEHGALKTDNTFMTNADTPSIVFKNIIPNAKNPFTGNPFEVQNKEAYVKIAYHSSVENLRSRYNKKFKINDDEWYTVKDDIFKTENWKKLNESGEN